MPAKPSMFFLFCAKIEWTARHGAGAQFWLDNWMSDLTLTVAFLNVVAHGCCLLRRNTTLFSMIVSYFGEWGFPARSTYFLGCCHKCHVRSRATLISSIYSGATMSLVIFLYASVVAVEPLSLRPHSQKAHALLLPSLHRVPQKLSRALLQVLL